jgi:hypothetical protein
MVAYHGAEAALILYPEEARSEVLRETLHSQVKVLPEREPHLDELRRQALSQFFSAPTESQRRFLANRLDHGFFATVGTLRPNAALAMREELAGQRLYLDTNVLIPALGGAGKRVGIPVKRLLKLTRDLGIELAVTSRTLAEYRYSLKGGKEEIKKNLPGRRFAWVLKNEARRSGGISLAEGYFESYEKNGTDLADWFRKISLEEPQLKELEIEVVDDELAHVSEREEARVEAYIKLLDRSAVQWRKDRDEMPMQHDVIHRLLIERLRGGEPHDFRSAKYWFLTEDKLLPRFGLLAVASEKVPGIPFCMSGSAWAQIARCFTPRTDDYDQMVTDLLASPYISFGRSRSFNEVQQVVNRITTLLEDASPAVVAAFVGDEVLEAVAGAPEQAEKDEVMVEAYEHKKDELGENLDVLTARIEQMQAELAAKEAEAEDAQKVRERLEAAELLLAEERKEANYQRALNEDEIRALKMDWKAAQEARKREDQERKAAEETERRKWRRRAGVIVSTLAEAALVVLAILGLISPGVLLAGAGLVLALVFVRALDNPRWAARIGYFLAVIGILLTLAQMI